MLDQPARHVAYIISERGKAYSRSRNESHARFTIEHTANAEEEWILKIISRAGAFSGVASCTPSYFNQEGLRLNEDQASLAARFSIWGEGIRSFVKEIEDWRNKGQFIGLDISLRKNYL